MCRAKAKRTKLKIVQLGKENALCVCPKHVNVHNYIKIFDLWSDILRSNMLNRDEDLKIILAEN